jgi:hypothetical protein
MLNLIASLSFMGKEKKLGLPEVRLGLNPSSILEQESPYYAKTGTLSTIKNACVGTPTMSNALSFIPLAQKEIGAPLTRTNPMVAITTRSSRFA